MTQCMWVSQVKTNTSTCYLYTYLWTTSTTDALRHGPRSDISVGLPAAHTFYTRKGNGLTLSSPVMLDTVAGGRNCSHALYQWWQIRPAIDRCILINAHLHCHDSVEVSDFLNSNIHWAYFNILFILGPCQHDDDYIDDRSQIKVHTDERTQVHSARSFLTITYLSTNPRSTLLNFSERATQLVLVATVSQNTTVYQRTNLVVIMEQH